MSLTVEPLGKVKGESISHQGNKTMRGRGRKSFGKKERGYLIQEAFIKRSGLITLLKPCYNTFALIPKSCG